MKRFIILGCLIALTGCQTTPTKNWNASGALLNDLEQNRARCERLAQAESLDDAMQRNPYGVSSKDEYDLYEFKKLQRSMYTLGARYGHKLKVKKRFETCMTSIGYKKS